MSGDAHTPSETAGEPETGRGGWRMRALFLIPLAVFLVIAGYLAIGLTRDPSVIPSALIDKPVPEFDLPPIQGYKGDGFSSADLKGDGISVVNVFASWCIPCIKEHRYINRLADMKIADVYGLNYKDEPQAARNWLQRLGDNFTATGADRDGRVGIDWGVYGVPETFIIDRDGRIRYKHVGAIDETALEETIVPIIRKLAQK